ncbi:MAG: hypothetical protein P4L27_07600 [Ignavibacteriaceae bacterium]|nr:hypothetical protein [Ignavibacteriaceae bacterium]
MSKSKDDLNIHFKGKTDGLVIKINGKVIYPFKEEETAKEINPNKLRTQLKAGVAATFSGAVNRVVPLRGTWKRWPVKSRVPYRNILAANINKCTAEHPTTRNLICPDSPWGLPGTEAVIDAEGIKIVVGPIADQIDLYEYEKLFTAAGVLSVYNPREKENESYSIYPLGAEIKDLDLTKNISVNFRFSDEMKVNIARYQKCILYFTIVIGNEFGTTKRWLSGYPSIFLLSNDAEGKLIGGEYSDILGKEY